MNPYTRHPKPVHPAARRRRRAGGFTLIEAALTTVIVGTGVLAIVAAQQAYHMKNDWAQRTGTAQQLANELRELTLTLPMYHPVTGGLSPGLTLGSDNIRDYHAVYDFVGPIGTDGQGQGVTFNPPVSALRREFTDLENWSQHIEVQNVYEDWFDVGTPPPPGSTDAMRVRVTVSYQAPYQDEPQTITHLTWIVGR